MRRLADAKGVQPHEYPLRVVFIDEVFTQENGMRNANEKLLWTKVCASAWATHLKALDQMARCCSIVV